MNHTKIAHTQWLPEKSLIETRLSGNLNLADIEDWDKSFLHALENLEDHTPFKILVNLHGFKAADLPTHKRFREVVPRTLANYGWKVGYLGLFEEEAKNLSIVTTRGIACIGAAHAHHDETKMNLYEERFGHDREHFFTEPMQARKWI